VRSRAVVLVPFLFLALTANAETFNLLGFVTGRGIYATGQPSWVQGGFGRFDTGGEGVNRGAGAAVADMQLGFDWQPVSHVLVHAHGDARAEPSENRGRRAGLVSAYVEGNWGGGRSELSVRAGQFFLGTSRENVAELWSTPYALSESTLNTWVAQEVRPVGVTAEWRLLTSTALITTSATAFRGNDTMGALLAWRGWTSGSRLTVFNEVLPLPPLRSLRQVFVHQRSDGTKPFGTDLDGRTGYAARVRYSIPERASIQFTRIDNEGDRGLHRGEYAWRTPFNIVGADAHLGDVTLASEWMYGRSGMGDPRLTAIDIDFHSAYLLASYKTGRNRFSGRYEVFATQDRHPVAGERYDEHGRGWTFAWLLDVAKHVRGGLEFTQITGTHQEAEESGFSPVIDGRSVILEIRYSLR
jgi:hypothetical protein